MTVNKASNSILLVYNFGSEDPETITYSAETISGLLDLNLTDSIKRVTGVGDLTYFGNRKLAFRLWLDPDKLTAFGLTSTDVVNQLSSQNRLVPAGQVGGEPSPKGQQFTFTVQLQGRLRSVEEFESMVVRTAEEGGLVRLRDVGSVQLGGESYAVSATDLQGVPSVGLAVYQLTGSNALEVSDGVKSVLAEFEKTMPVGMKMEKIYDNTDFITASIQGVVNSLRDAVILVVLILFLFLQNWKATLVPGIAIPVALIGTFGLVLGFGFSLNQLTLFGLVLATGLVVDDAITVIEDTSSKKAEGMTALEAAKATMDELFSAVIATSLVKFAVFLPVLFFPGATGTIYKQFAATVIFSIAISTFNALTFSPMLSALLLARESKDPGRKSYAIAGTVIGFVYGLLVVGGGAALVLVPTAIGALAGLLLGRVLDRPATLPFTIGGAIAGLIHHRGKPHPACGHLPRIGSGVGLVHPGDLRQLQPRLCGDGKPLCRCPAVGTWSPKAGDEHPRRWHPADGRGVSRDPRWVRSDRRPGICHRRRAGARGGVLLRSQKRSISRWPQCCAPKKTSRQPPFSAVPASMATVPIRACSSSAPPTGRIVSRRTNRSRRSWSASTRNWRLAWMVLGCLLWSPPPFPAMAPVVDLSSSCSTRAVVPTAWRSSTPQPVV